MGYSQNFEPNFQPLQLATASQIVSHILRMWRLMKHCSRGSRNFLRRGANSQNGCANLLFCKSLAENCTKMKEFGPPREACVPGTPLGSTNALESCEILMTALSSKQSTHLCAVDPDLQSQKLCLSFLPS